MLVADAVMAVPTTFEIAMIMVSRGVPIASIILIVMDKGGSTESTNCQACNKGSIAAILGLGFVGG